MQPPRSEIFSCNITDFVASHTGLVISVSGDKFVTIEGNTNDGSGVVAEELESTRKQGTTASFQAQNLPVQITVS